MRDELADITYGFGVNEGSPSIDRASGTALFKWHRIQHDADVRSLNFWLTAKPTAASGRTHVRAEILCEETGRKQIGQIAVEMVEGS